MPGPLLVITDSKLGKKYVKAVYCHPAYLTYVQSILCKMPCWMKQKLESRWPGEILISYSDGTTDSMEMSLSKLWQLVMDRVAWRAVIHGVTKSRT